MTVKSELRRRGRLAPYLLRPDRLSSGLYAWYDATKIVASDGDSVSTWADQSGNARDLTQTGTNRPVYKVNIFGSQPAVLFTSASSQYMVNNAMAALFTGTDPAYTMALVLKQATTTGTPTWIGATNSTDASRQHSFWGNGATDYRDYNQNDSHTIKQASGGSGPNTSAHVLTATFDGTTERRYRDGTQLGTDFAMSTGVATTLDRFALGCYPATVPNSFMNGHIAEVVLVSRALSTLELTEVTRYLGRKYGVAVA